MHTQCTYHYASAIASESGWTSFLVLTFFISIIYGGLAHFYVHMEKAIHGNRHADQDADYRA